MVTNASLLVVENNEAVRLSLCDWLGAVFPQHLSVGASNIDQGIALAQNFHPRVIIVDADLSEGLDLEIIRRIKGVVPTAEILLLMTKCDCKAYQDDALAAGASVCLNIWRLWAELQPTIKRLLADD
jgi:DNA-binding NarL/FixJ family response regulator